MGAPLIMRIILLLSMINHFGPEYGPTNSNDIDFDGDSDYEILD